MEDKFADVLFERLKNGDLELDLGGHLGSEIGPVTYDDPLWNAYWSKDSFLQRLCGKGSHELFMLMLSDDLLDRKKIENGELTAEEWKESREALWNLFATDPMTIIGMLPDGPMKEKHKDGLLLCRSFDVECNECGERLNIRYDGKRLFTDSVCEIPGGLKPWTIELDVPSGKLVFENDFRNLFPEAEEDEHANVSVNLTKGVKLTEEMYAKYGMFHCFVGNTCPGIYKFPDGRVVIGSYPDEVYNKDTEEYEPVDHGVDQYSVGSICTDLWWFSAMDHDEYVKRGGDFEKRGWVTPDVVEVEPGRYKLTSYYSCRGYGEDANEYAVIEKIG